MNLEDTLNEYVALLLDYNKKINLVSRKISPEQINQLIQESLLLDEHISNDIIIDAGSGNGLLGIPLAIVNKNKQFILVEPKKKKSLFLNTVKTKMELANIDVHDVSIEEFLKGKHDSRAKTIIARGFPDLSVFCRFLEKGMITEAVLITSENKIKKNQNDLESVMKKTYNVPLRNDLRILKMMKTRNQKLRKINEQWRN